MANIGKLLDNGTYRVKCRCAKCNKEMTVMMINDTYSDYHKYDGEIICNDCLSEKDKFNERVYGLTYYIPGKRDKKKKPKKYANYLQSKHWKGVRQTALERAENRCQLCNKKGKLHVHHRTYENLGQEKDSDLIVLCGSCHAKFHDIIN